MSESTPTTRLTPGRLVRFVVLPALLGSVLTGAVIFVPLAGWTTNDVTTGTHTGYPDLQPRSYDASVSTTTQFAAAAATRQKNWKVVRTELATGKVQVEVPSGPFTDDLTVTITPKGEGSHVVIRSHSRVGFGDLGANVRHIRVLQAAMDDKLPRLAE